MDSFIQLWQTEFLSIVSLAGRTNHLLNGIKVPIDLEFDHENKIKVLLYYNIYNIFSIKVYYDII